MSSTGLEISFAQNWQTTGFSKFSRARDQTFFASSSTVHMKLAWNNSQSPTTKISILTITLEPMKEMKNHSIALKVGTFLLQTLRTNKV
jgi:hypothetical protein